MDGQIVGDYFKPAKRDRRQANMGNTVLVNLDGEKDFYLDYLQDINGQNVYVDFDCTTIPPRWISAQRVWLHELLEKQYPQSQESPAYVALRQQPNGPYIFRPAIRMKRYSTHGDLFYSYVRLANDTAARPWRLVHRWQMVERLPELSAPSLLERLPAVNYRKFSVSAPQVRLLEHIDEHRIISVLNAAFRGGYSNFAGWDRVFVRMEGDTIHFLVMDIYHYHPRHRCANPRCWTDSTAEKVEAGLRDYMMPYCNHPEFRPRLLRFGEEKLDEQPMMNFLLPEIMSEIVLHLDVRSQVRGQRVCSLWAELLDNRASAVSITLDLHNISAHMPTQAATEAYHVAFILNRTVNETTKTLTLIGMTQRSGDFDLPYDTLQNQIEEYLRLKRTQLLAIVVQDYRSAFRTISMVPILMPRLREHDVYFIPSRLNSLCRKLLLVNCVVELGTWLKSKGSVNKFPVLPGWDAADSPDFFVTVSRFWMTSKRKMPGDPGLFGHFGVVIGCGGPPVSVSVRDKIKQLHAYWVDKVPYPGKEWEKLRQLVELFGLCEMSLAPGFWSELDLRNFDGLPLTNLLLAVLAYLYLPAAALEQSEVVF
ncbi:uncharacterized protein LOC129596441 [Paramacrobiotus metropolitanus]|uniref:uncharacterized protein LOC129596441 n=1 Tax=Paramacrobiotus metropolitanus TaxID=2943436 RepID=UPI0024464318|nr:uncharacterized protein LOC129596441 [Paramacrobiotus metropolitanus]